MMDIVKNIAAVVGLIVSVGALLCTTIPNLRATIVRWAFKDKEHETLKDQVSQIKMMMEEHVAADSTKAAELEKIKESQRCILRDRITRIYYRHLDDKTLHSYEVENMTHMKEAYDDLEGNSFVGTICGQMKDWTVIP